MTLLDRLYLLLLPARVLALIAALITFAALLKVPQMFGRFGATLVIEIPILALFIAVSVAVFVLFQRIF